MQCVGRGKPRNDLILVQTGTFLRVIISNDTQVTVKQAPLATLLSPLTPNIIIEYRQIENIAESHGREQVD